MKHLWEMIRQSVEDLIDRMNRWAAGIAALEEAETRLAAVTWPHYAKDVRFLAEQLKRYGIPPVEVVNAVTDDVVKGFPPDELLKFLLDELDAYERSG